ncbi:MAG: endopeptidase La, partial [candidate division Zixibacteria bacterium]|nr:endopeptidase La [candidate division Zixibacteria bacterium]
MVKSELKSNIKEVTLLPLKGMVVFPYLVMPLMISNQKYAKMVDEALLEGKTIGLFTQKPNGTVDENDDNIFRIGTSASILKMLRFPDGSVRFLVQGLSRIRLRKIVASDPYLTAEVEELEEDSSSGVKLEALTRNIHEILKKVTDLAPYLSEENYISAINQENPSKLADFVASNLNLNVEQKQEMLQTIGVRERLEKLLTHLNKEYEVLELSKKIQAEAASEMGKLQKEYILKEQLKAIQKELGMTDERTEEINEFETKIKEAKMPDVAEEASMKELDRLSKMNPSSAEYTVSRSYLDWMVSLPWQRESEDKLDIEPARKILDQDHYDLEKVKDRILEYLAVRKLKTDLKGPILCFVGPPGVGKTSLGRSIARALGRKFERISLGGMHDEAEIRGHRRTYIGSLPGRIIQGLKRSGTKNPVFMLDEIDKVGKDFRGDPASALLEVLDPEQNDTFSDHYLDVPFDLSKVMFITTANMLDTIPDVLLDRMEVIRIPGYTDLEKVQIAKKFLIPRELNEHGLKKKDLSFTSKALRNIINYYTRESGLRNLDRELATVCRKVAKDVAMGKKGKVNVKPEDIKKYLGAPKFVRELAERVARVGVAPGLAWTPTGGDVLFIEATKMKGKGNLSLTGHLGDVMKESVQAAYSYIRTIAKKLDLDESVFENVDVHVHVPSGAVPKDGPSAGIVMASAIASLFTGRPVKPRIAMTGEITLRGMLLPIGGLKEKSLGAYRAGIKTIILPEANKKDIDDIPDELKKKLTYKFVKTIDEAIKLILEPAKKK